MFALNIKVDNTQRQTKPVHNPYKNSLDNILDNNINNTMAKTTNIKPKLLKQSTLITQLYTPQNDDIL